MHDVRCIVRNSHHIINPTPPSTYLPIHLYSHDDLEPPVLRLLLGYEYPRLLATAAAVALRTAASESPHQHGDDAAPPSGPLHHELALSVSSLLASYRGERVGRLLLGDVEALSVLGALLAPEAPLAAGPHGACTLPRLVSLAIVVEDTVRLTRVSHTSYHPPQNRVARPRPGPRSAPVGPRVRAATCPPHAGERGGG